MFIKDHAIISGIRSQLLVRVQYVIVQLGKEHTNKTIAHFLGCSQGTVSKLRHYSLGDVKSPIRNLDRLLRICQLLKIDYSFSVKTVRGKPSYKFESGTVVNWSPSTINILSTHKRSHL